jgi:MYXO-CTERM domain-containing protein
MMTRTTLRTAFLLATAATGASLGYATPADAAYPAVLQLTKGVGGEKEQNGGAGAEQLHSAVLDKNGKEYVVTVFMSSDVEQGNWQCKCTSTLMDPVLGPLVVVDQKQLTNNGGNRPCNHARVATDGKGLGVWGYGTNETNGNTRTYVQGINEMCELTTDRLRISENGNQNEGAMDIAFIADGWFTAGYLSTANNDLDASYAVGVYATNDGTTATVEKKWIKNVVNPSNVGRPAIVEAGPNRAFFCAAQGNNRPPEDGVTCALLDTMTGEILHKQLIAKSDPANNRYFNQPSIAKIGTNLFAVQVLESNGLGKKNNLKGVNISHLYAFKVSEALFSQEGYIKNVGKYPTHSSICSGSYGEGGKTYVGVMGASPTGLGQPSMQFVEWNVAAFKVNDQADNWTMGFYGDSGLIANLYGANPNTQGRDFLRCMGNVRNPGFGVKNGYMPEVETFFLAPHAGNIPGDPKNAGFITFVPGKVAVPVAPEAPKEQPKTGLAPQANPDPGTDPTDPGTDPTDPGTDPGGEDPEGSVNIPKASACSIPASNGSSSSGLAFLALGIGALFAARRRK